MASENQNSHLRAIHSDGVEVLKRMNTHTVRSLRQRKDVRLDYGTLLGRAEKVVEDPGVEVTFYVEADQQSR